MEQLLLGMLQEQLGKYIVGFRKEMVNASLLNGKGEITDLSLNCAAINQQLSNIMPFIELESIHISKVSFQVTSWTNLRKSPIMVDIEHINVHISEPLHYLYPKKRRRIRHMTVSEMEQHFQQLQEECRKNKTTFNNPNKRGGYSLVDRILDNLHIEIKSIYVQFQTWGKFKTRRPGPWTPPTLQFKLRNLRYVSVDEYGQEGTPDEVWAHNHRPVPRGQERTLLVFKKVSMEYDFGVKSADGTQHFSLLKGGQGVEPETSATTSQKPTTTTNEKGKSKPKSPTAAEVVAALALGPVDVEVPETPDAAAETVAALAGEPKTSTNDKKPTSEKVSFEPGLEKKEEQSSSQDKTLDDATSTGPQHSEDPKAPQEMTGEENNKEGEEAKSDKESAASPPTENGGKASQDNGNKSTTDSAPKTEGAQSSSSPPPPTEDDRNNNIHDENNKVVVQMAMKRRVRDGALLSAQVDTTLSKVEILLPAEVVPLLIHAALGVQFCFAKDRGFEDPLRHPDDHTDHNEASARNLYYSHENAKETDGDDENAVSKDNPSQNTEEGKEKEPLQEKDLEKGKQEIGGGSATPSVDTTTSESQAPQVKELAAVAGESIPSADTTVPQPELDDIQKESTAGEEREIKVPDSVLEVLGSEGVGNMSISGDGLSAAGLSVLEETIAEDPADTDTLDDGSTGSQLQPAAEEGRGFAKSITSLFSRRSVTTLTSSEATTAVKEAAAGSTPTTPSKSDNNNTPGPNGGVQPVDRAIIMLPNGLVIHEKLSFSVSVDRATIRGVYASPARESSGVENNKDTSNGASEKYVGEQDRDKNDFIQVDSKGAVMEVIWPKSDLKKGGYVQASVSYMSVQERYGRRIRTIVSGGVKQDPLAKPIEKNAPPLEEVAKEEAFPLFEDRAIREDPLDLRRSFPAQAVGLLATIDCQTRKKAPPRTDEKLSLPTTITTSKNDNDSTSALPQTSPEIDNTTQEKEVSGEQEEVVDVIMVTNDLGVDQINLALDCDCWCRALRFFLNESGGGFDCRWFSGDWADLLTIEMLVHPNTPLDLEDHFQPLKEFYLDENHFVSSDLLHVNAKISGCELRIPAAIQENVRSCDIVITVDETFMVASSDLPREFLSGNIGSTFCQQENDPSDLPNEVKFPNDPSDVSVELQNSEDPSKRQSYMMMANTNELVKAKSVFRLNVKLLGMSTQIIPVIPFFVSSQPRQLCSPTDMSIGFCFEGEPPETEDTNEIKMVIFSSIVIDHIETNLDLDLIAGAVSTLLHHVQVVKETVECAKQLIPMHVANDDDPSVASVSNNERDDDLSTAASARIVKSLRGHRVLVRRQLHRSRETGGLQIASFLQVANYGFTLWRHNVAVYSPVHSAEGVANIVERQKLNFPLLKLLSFGAKNIEVGMELSFPDDERRVVLKCGVEEAQLRLCKLKEGAASESGDVDQPSNIAEPQNGVSVEEDEETKTTEDEKVDSTEETGSDRYDMVDIFHVGRNVPLPPVSTNDDINTATQRQQAILLRYEEYFSGFRSRSLVAEVGTGGTATLCIDQIETVFVLVLEALIMPTWSKSIKFPLIEKRRFPERSVGALLHSLLPGPGGRFRFWRFLRKLIALLLPGDLRLLLLRVRIDEMLVTIPSVKGPHAINSECREGELMLRYLDLVTWYISSENQFHNNILSVAAMEGKPWSSLVSTESTGINHRLRSRQSFRLTGKSNATTQEQTPNEILPEFAVALEYLHAQLSASMENTLSLYETDQLRDCLRFLALFGKRCVDIFFHLRRRLAFLKRRGHADEEEEQSNCEKDSYQPINAACADMEKSVRTAKDFVLRMCRYFDDSIRDHDAALRQKGDEVKRLQRQVFLKEKERVAAVSMASSPIAGWLRVGGTHQSGMRVATTSTLWRYWAVLRRDMLILYSAPGKYKPVDLVLLRGARLRVLAGGRSKWDLKRAFGVVESEGKTRFFVAESEVEYNGWTREIEKITSFHTAVENESEMKTVASGAEIDGESIPNVLSDRDEESVGLDSAGPKTTDSVKSEREAAVTEHTPKQGFRGKLANLGSSLKKSRQDMPIDSTENESASAPTKTEEVKAIDSTAGIVSEGLSLQPSENPDSPKKIAGQDVSVSRRLQFGKVAGVGRAFMAATKKTGREVAERTRRAATPGSSSKDDINTSRHNALQVISERDGEKNWTCPKCTFINKTKETDVDILICAVCESPSEAGEVEFELTPEDAATQNETSTSAEVLIVADTEEDVKREPLDSTDTDQGVFRRSQSTPMEQRDRLNSADSDADLFRRSQSSGSFGGLIDEDDTSIISDLAMDEMSEAARSAGGRRSSRGRLAGLGASLGSAARRNRQARPPEPEKKGWFARLGSSVSNNQEEPDGFQKNQPALKLKNIRIDPSIDLVSGAPASFNTPLRKLDGQCFVTVCDCSEEEAEGYLEWIHKDGDGSSVLTPPQVSAEDLTGQVGTGANKSIASHTPEHLFSIQVFSASSDDARKQPKSRVVRSFSDVISFHVEISEIVAELMHHPMFHERSLERTAAGDMTSGLQNAMGISPLDCIRISGAFLAGLEEARSSSSPVEIPLSRQAEVLMDFLNATLECPLSSAGHFALKDFLSIQDFTSTEVWSAPVDDDLDGETTMVTQTETPAKEDETPAPHENEQQQNSSTVVEQRKADVLMELSTSCMEELVIAEQNGRLATNLLGAIPTANTNWFGTAAQQPSYLEPLLPNYVTENLQEAMHAALMKVMAERDEAHAQLVSASVLHAHTLEQERKKVDRLSAKLDLANKLQLNTNKGALIFGGDRKKAQAEKEEREKLQKMEMEMQQNSDAEIVALCQQLSGEISSRTQAALEVIRLKESRTIERQHEAEEKEALRDELTRLKERLAYEELKTEEARREAEQWKQYYERATASKEGNRSDSQPSP